MLNKTIRNFVIRRLHTKYDTHSDLGVSRGVVCIISICVNESVYWKKLWQRFYIIIIIIIIIIIDKKNLNFVTSVLWLISSLNDTPPFLNFPSTPKIEVVYSSETYVNFYQTTLTVTRFWTD
jgi:hypothetical protein